MKQEVSQLFQETFNEPPSQLAFAPGRIEFIGNHTDYNGGLVMGAAVAEGISVAIAPRTDRRICLVSTFESPAEASLDRLEPLEGSDFWANYPLGVTKVMLESGLQIDNGFNLAVASTLPTGAGLSSSAAFELATAYALAALNGFDADKKAFARMGRQAENEFVGMPCGILDQGVSAFGEVDSLVRIDCADEVFVTKAMPAGTHFWIFNSNKKHALVESAYADRHKECHSALAILQKTYPEAQTLSQIDQGQLDSSKEALGELLYRRACHIVGENDRVRAVDAALVSGDLTQIGAVLLASHKSSRDNFENSTPELDFLADALNDTANVYGSRLTGGGFGGAVMAFTNDAFSESEATVVAEAYREQFGLDATVIHTRAGSGARLL
jgi:galactokinase